MHALDHGAVLRRHQAGRLRAGDAERVHGLLRVEPKPARRAGRGREHAEASRRNASPGRYAPGPCTCRRAVRSRSRRPRRRGIRGPMSWRGFPPPRSAPAASPRRNAARRRDARRRVRSPAPAVPLTSAACVEDSLRSVPQIDVVRVASSSPSVSCRMRHHSQLGAVDGAAERIENQQLDALAHLGAGCAHR